MGNREEARYWRSLYEVYVREHYFPTMMIDLDIRRFFQRSVLIKEMESWDHLSRHRPSMKELYLEEIEEILTTVQQTAIKKNHRLQGSKDAMRQKLKTRLIDQASTATYCFHCKSTVDRTPEYLCPICCGWWLLQMDTRDLEDKPTVPDHVWNAVQARLEPPKIADLREDAIENLTITGEHVDQEYSCGICLKRLKEGRVVKQTICEHIFHRHCIKKWFRAQEEGFSRRCPICNTTMPTVDPLYNIYIRVRAKAESRPIIPPTP